MATLGTMFAVGAFALGGKEKSKQQGPPINATNKDEEKFIQYVEIFGAQSPSMPWPSKRR